MPILFKTVATLGWLSPKTFLAIGRDFSKYSIAFEYSPKSKVYIRYPNNFEDWIKQKKRSAGGYNQIRKLTGIEIRSFKKESLGSLGLFKFTSNFKELMWLLSLFLARVYLWTVIYRDINIKKKSHKEIWQRVESTKWMLEKNFMKKMKNTYNL